MDDGCCPTSDGYEAHCTALSSGDDAHCGFARASKNNKKLQRTIGAESDQKPRRTLLDADLWAGCLCNKLYLTTDDDSDEHGVLCSDDGGAQGGGASNKSSNDQQHSE